MPKYDDYIKPTISNLEVKLVANHADFETENHNGEPCVRLYLTVKSKSIISSMQSIGENYLGESDYKDICSNSDGSLVFSTGKNEGLWVNVGRPFRALFFYDKYKKEDEDSHPLVRSWLISVKKYREIFENSTVLPTFTKTKFFRLNEKSQTSDSDVVNVDNYTPNQFLVKIKSSIL